jgi:hypothetical protein
MPIRKYGNEPAQVETRDEDNDQETLSGLKAQAAFEESGVAAQVDEFLANPETGVRRERPAR